MLAHLADVSIRSLLPALVAAIVLWILRARRTAALEHAVWALVVCGMLGLFAFSPALPPLPLRIPSHPVLSPVPPMAGPRSPLPDALPVPLPAGLPAVRRSPLTWGEAASFVYAVVALALLSRFATGIVLVRRLLAQSRPVGRFLESDRISVPLTVGCLRPKILLPPEWQDWDRAKLRAVLAHEGAHVRRRDSLVAALAAVNRCLFWFHPLAWILEHRLALLAEQAADEYTVAALGDRESYAHLLLEMALIMDRSEGRLRGHALTMAAASHIRRRIDALLQDGRTFSQGLTRAGWAAVLFCGIPLLWTAGAVQFDRRPVLAQSSATTPAATPRSKFDVASIRPCGPGDASAPGRNGRKGTGSGGYLGRSPGRLWVTCMSVASLVDIAYGQFGDPLTNDSDMPFDQTRLRGGPRWAHSDRYTIQATTGNPVAKGPTQGRSPAFRIMSGPMLQSLLEDRFQLQTHREIEQVPMYALTVAKGGLKLKPTQPGDCVPDGPPEWLPGGKPACGWTGWGVHGPNRTLVGGGVTLSRLAELGDLFLDRHIIDRTGISTIFNFRLEYAPDENTPSKLPPAALAPLDPDSDIAVGTSIFTALEQQLGLKLESIKAPHGFIVIDHVERPSEN